MMHPIRRTALILGALTLASSFALTGPAAALSCMPYGVTNAWHDAAADPADYLVVHGRLTFDQTRLPKADMTNQAATPPQTPIAARLTGKALTTQGFAAAFDHDVTLVIKCFGPWCAGAKSGEDYLAFVKKTTSGFEIMFDPCGGYAFGRPSPEQLQQVITCQKGGACEKVGMDRRRVK